MLRQHNILSKKVTLATDVTEGQILSLGGKLANSGSGTDEPVGVTMYEGKTGEIVAVMCIGLMNVPQDGTLKLGDPVKVTNGAVAKADPTTDKVFATVSEVVGIKEVELLLK